MSEVPQRVLVLGFGNSAMDIAVETSRVSTMTYIAVRRGFHVIPKYILGRPLGQAHPTVSSDILTRITHGCVKVKPNIHQLDGDGVIFEDGSREQIDSIIYFTGYKITFPFFRPAIFEARNNDLPLYNRSVRLCHWPNCNAPRHTIQVDVEPYVKGVLKEMQRGEDRPATPLIAPNRAFFSGASSSMESEAPTL